ncbi:outer membrane beta-barrel protein [Nitratireductor sp. L1-7-SE]|uniref:Outer membrane beta-barrel protein n=1 Tax=Nitratireductor rhodophyticola TaxID=2854036 RepID=A0ABS7R9W3_9HYPH|nr:outer membrane beta-barrel protein [Nitratireductor rhodophyticola]MBY8917726.1 outer membrane beta-barrel protein [Nitratireductor rhodophyticola]MBY8922437.1 outer membrane beta-barrel protein [Nitratireductor rhodophyticola]
MTQAAAQAQQAEGLRGLVSETDITSSIQSTAETGLPSPRYEPATPSPAEPAEAENERSTRAPSTAVARERARTAQNDRTRPVEPPLDTVVTQGIPENEEENAGFERIERAEALNPRTGAIESDFQATDENPYAPLGLRFGSFTVIPTLEQGLTWTSNADSSTNGSEAIVSQSTLRLNAVSDWARHAATVDAYGIYRKSVSGDEVSDIEGGIDGTLRFDLARDYTALASLGYSISPESASSPVIITGVDERPLRHTIDGSLGLSKDFGKLRLSATGSVSRQQYGDATLIDGSTLSQKERNATLATLRLRTGYAISPALTPFIEGEFGRRFYDETQDSAGYERSATRLAARAGVMVDIEEKLSGEASIGWIAEDLDDERLDTVSGLALAAALNWSPQRGTNVRFDGSTTIEGTTDAGDSGSILYAGTLRLERQIRANLTAEAAAGLSWRDYMSGGHDLTMNGEAGMTWWLNRTLGLTGRARYEKRTSSLPGRDYDATSVFMGIRMQR